MAYKFARRYWKLIKWNRRFLNHVSWPVALLRLSWFETAESRYFYEWKLKKIKHPLSKKLFKKAEFFSQVTKTRIQFFINLTLKLTLPLRVWEAMKKEVEWWNIPPLKKRFTKRGQSEAKRIIYGKKTQLGSLEI